MRPGLRLCLPLLRSVEFNLAEAHELIPLMGGRDVADGAGFGPHHDAGRACAAAEVLDAIQQLTARDAGGGKEYVIAANEIIPREDLRQI